MYLYETHLAVADTEISKNFYIGTVGLTFAHRDATRDVVFLWAGPDRKSMLGLWGPGTTYGERLHKSHLAFALALPELIAVGLGLKAAGVKTVNFNNEETIEPSVIGWMPSAQLYFRDPDDHTVEFISLLDDAPEPTFIGPLSKWQSRPS
jgi:lactoylglutathione lyase